MMDQELLNKIELPLTLVACGVLFVFLPGALHLWKRNGTNRVSVCAYLVGILSILPALVVLPDSPLHSSVPLLLRLGLNSAFLSLVGLLLGIYGLIVQIKGKYSEGWKYSILSMVTPAVVVTILVMPLKTSQKASSKTLSVSQKPPVAKQIISHNETLEPVPKVSSDSPSPKDLRLYHSKDFGFSVRYSDLWKEDTNLAQENPFAEFSLACSKYDLTFQVIPVSLMAQEPDAQAVAKILAFMSRVNVYRNKNELISFDLSGDKETGYLLEDYHRGDMESLTGHVYRMRLVMRRGMAYLTALQGPAKKSKKDAERYEPLRFYPDLYESFINSEPQIQFDAIDPPEPTIFSTSELSRHAGFFLCLAATEDAFKHENWGDRGKDNKGMYSAGIIARDIVKKILDEHPECSANLNGLFLDLDKNLNISREAIYN